MPCHVLNCGCARFAGDAQVYLCPVCAREYATRASLEIHLYGHHAALSSRERSVLLQGALNYRAPAVRPVPPRARAEEPIEA